MRRRRKESEFSSQTLARRRREIWERFSATDWWICLFFLAGKQRHCPCKVPQQVVERRERARKLSLVKSRKSSRIYKLSRMPVIVYFSSSEKLFIYFYKI